MNLDSNENAEVELLKHKESHDADFITMDNRNGTDLDLQFDDKS